MPWYFEKTIKQHTFSTGAGASRWGGEGAGDSNLFRLPIDDLVPMKNGKQPNRARNQLFLLGIVHQYQAAREAPDT